MCTEPVDPLREPRKIAQAGGIPLLVDLTRKGSDAQKEQAAAALRGLACDGPIKASIARAGGIEPLVALARGGTAAQKEQAKTALTNLAHDNDDNRKAMSALGYTP